MNDCQPCVPADAQALRARVPSGLRPSARLNTALGRQMKTRELREKDGRLTGFIVSNVLLGRHGVPKIVASIPGAQIIRKQAPFRLNGRDDFCEFIVDGKTFLAIEPFGDNNQFWVVAEPPEECPQLAKVREAFTKHRVLFGLYGG